jgi:hypothetical protein
MATGTFYVIRLPRDRYIDGTPMSWTTWTGFSNGRKFKSIAEIRSFMTRMLKYTGDISGIEDWEIEKHIIEDSYPLTRVFTSSHTMALLKHQNKV